MTTYGEAGVDLGRAADHVQRIASSVRSTWGPNVLGGFGGFAAGLEMPGGYHEPVLMMTTDGVGTKLELARLTGMWEGIGHDLVAMCVDDLAAAGARPLGLVDYLAVGALDEHRDAAIVESIARACALAGCALLGGETAEHPGVMASDAVDLAGAAMGVAERGELIGPDRVEVGDVVLGLISPNLRSNGFSLVRKVLGADLAAEAPGLLEPSVIYSPAVLRAIAERSVRSAAHVTGGGLAENLARALPATMGAQIDTSTWAVPAVFESIATRGVDRAEMRRVFNMGIGFCLIVGPDDVGRAVDALDAHEPRPIGRVTGSPGIDIE
jgi:phosphoribosylformylglycinamidine cyclo-ligase